MAIHRAFFGSQTIYGKAMARDLDLEKQIALLARRRGKFVAIQHYRAVTGTSVKRARAAVEVILFHQGVPSMTRPHFGNWRRYLFLAIPATMGLLLAWGLVVLFR